MTVESSQTLSPASDIAALRSLDELDEALYLEPAGPSSWRVCDGRIARGQGRFLAFVEQKVDTFEVMQIADDFLWTSFPTMRAALDHVVDSNGALATERSSGKLAWLQ